MKIMMTGGGTLGPITPLLAIADELKKLDPSVELVWITTPDGPENELLTKLGYDTTPVKTAKLPRYASLSLFTAPVVFWRSFNKARQIIGSEKPDLIMSAGGYVSVPFVWAGKLIGVPTWIHQLDVRPGLANKLMASFASRITTSWEKSLEDFPKEKTEWIGSPVRESLLKTDREAACREYGLDQSLPTVLITGAGLGAKQINEAMVEIGWAIVEKANVIHQTGQGKVLPELEAVSERYHVREFITEMDKAYAAADVVVSRAGMGTIAELAFLKKPAVVVPILHSQQEDNAAELNRNKAAVVFDSEMEPEILREQILDLLASHDRRKELSRNIAELLPTHGVATKIAEQILKEYK